MPRGRLLKWTSSSTPMPVSSTPSAAIRPPPPGGKEMPWLMPWQDGRASTREAFHPFAWGGPGSPSGSGLDAYTSVLQRRQRSARLHVTTPALPPCRPAGSAGLLVPPFSSSSVVGSASKRKGVLMSLGDILRRAFRVYCRHPTELFL